MKTVLVLGLCFLVMSAVMTFLTTDGGTTCSQQVAPIFKFHCHGGVHVG